MGKSFWLTLFAGLPQLLSLIFIFVLVIATWQRRAKINWANIFLLVLFSIAIWDIADILELFSTSLEMYYAIIKFAYIGISTLPFFWFLFIVSYIGNDHWRTPLKLILSAIIPFLTIVFTFADESLHLMRTVQSYDATGLFPVVSFQYGPWFWVHSINSYIFLILGAILLFKSALTSSKLFFGQKMFLVLASFTPWITNLLYLTKISNSDYTSAAFTLLSMALAVSVFRYQLLNIVPIAREMVFENMTDAVIVLDHENRIIDLNPAARSFIDTKTVEYLGKEFSIVFPTFGGLLGKFPDKGELKEEIGLPIENPSIYFTVQINALLNKRGENLGKTIVLWDSTQQKFTRLALQGINQELEERVEQRTNELVHELETRKQVESALRESEERYSLAIQGANDGIWDWNLKSGKVFFSPRWKTILGYDIEESLLSIDAWFDKVHPDDLSLLKVELTRHLDNASPFFEFTHRILSDDKSLIWLKCRGLAIRGDDGIAYRISGSLSDFTKQKQFEEQILHDAFHDPLTGLPNRAFFLERVSHSIQRAKRSDTEQFAILYLDLDRFKNINDSLGHIFGDKLLIVCAEKLYGCIRSIDTVARLGADEFVILIDTISSLEEAILVNDRIAKSFSPPILLENHEVSVSVSIGIVIFSKQYDAADDILRDADIAMYQAKRNNVKKYEVFNLEMREKVNTRLELETELRQALEFDEFELFYQPIIRIGNKQIESFEALIRWNQPNRGFVLPSDFIPIAEETGLIIPIGQWVIKEACRQISAWKNLVPPEKAIRINVNLSTRQFSDPGLCEMVEKCLQDNKIEGSNLVLEITESAIIEDRDIVIDILNKFRAMGVQVQIDDFGTGYSSLSYLNTLPIDALKIDQSFVNQICDDDSCSGVEIIQTILSLGKDLGLKVIAEGVETQDELNVLTKMKCEFIQGYLISKPMNNSMAMDFLLQNIQKDTPTVGITSMSG